MGQKINPIGFRLAVQRNWTSRWYANSGGFSGMLLEDIKVRTYLRKRLAHAAVAKVIIERPTKNAKITIHSARPGVVTPRTLRMSAHAPVVRIFMPLRSARLRTGRFE